MTAFFRRAEEILEIACTDTSTLGDVLMVLDRQGGMRMLEPTGWSLPALAVEFGAEAVYKIERRGSSVRVEGWNGCQRCLFQSQIARQSAHEFMGTRFTPHATRFQLTAGLAVA